MERRAITPAEGEIRGSTAARCGRLPARSLQLEPPAAVSRLAVRADLVRDRIDVAPRGGEGKGDAAWQLRVSGAVAAQAAAPGSSAATKLYDLLPTVSP